MLARPRRFLGRRSHRGIGFAIVVVAACAVAFAGAGWAAGWATDPPADGEPATPDMSTPASAPTRAATPEPGAGAAGVGPTKASPSVVWVENTAAKFAISATEVTVGQFKVCLDAGKCDAGHHEEGTAERTSCNFGVPNRLTHPMNCVDHIAAKQFCSAQGGRLCAKSEWLSACSGPEGRPFPYGTQFDQLSCHAASRENPADGRPQHTLPVGSLGTCEGGLPGLYDMAGNVMEWISDCQGTYCKFLGGAYLGNDPLDLFNSCKGPCGGNQEVFRSATVGIRCCKDL